jgi:cytoskeleton protein RodZ
MTEIDKNESIVIEESESSEPSASEQLRLAREEKKLTIFEVAAQLRLPKDTITYLETGQWDKLHGRAYARGYFSNYVSFLGLPQDMLMAAFNIQYKVISKPLTTPNLQPIKKKKKFPFLLLFLIIIIGFSYQKWQSFNSEVTHIDEPLPTSQQNSNPIDTFSSSIVELLLDDVMVVDNEKELNVDSKLDNKDVIPEQIIETLDEELNELEGIRAGDNKKTAIIEPEKEIIIDEVVAKNVVIEMNFSGNSWVEVIDAECQVLNNKTVNSNKKVVLSGRPPLNVLLGFAPAVVVKYDDTIIDTAPYTQGSVARFSLGAAL